MEFSDCPTLCIRTPDDYHHHLRDGDYLKDIVSHAQKSFKRIIAMPNIKPPVRTLEDAIAYHGRISTHIEDASKFKVLMTLYLTDYTTSDDIVKAKLSNLVYACKLYPAGATTNSEFGVTHISKIKDVLQTMSDVGLPLLVHGEVTDPEIDVFDREALFITTVLQPLITEFPQLKIVMEHITTSEAVDFISSCSINVVATITAHHLLYNRTDIFRGGINPHMYCLPILKRNNHRLALLKAATSGSSKFFLGTDSAPHAQEMKETVCGCAGIFTAHAALELYAEAFDSVGALDKLEGFCSIFGAEFYGLPVNTDTTTLMKRPWLVPTSYQFGPSLVRPLRAGEEILWTILDKV